MYAYGDAGTGLVTVTATTISFRVVNARNGILVMSSTGASIQKASGYLRIIMLALE